MAEVGYRVIRGPNWPLQDEDGGEGCVGTVVEVGGKGKSTLPNNLVIVQWDMGNRMDHRTGYYGDYDLYVLDSAPAGVRHDGLKCSGCLEKPIYGMRWHCLNCKSHINLCTTCYMNDEHEKSHHFERIDRVGISGVRVNKRIGADKIQLRGIFSGAKVTRGPDWRWGDQDGGETSDGFVLEVDDWKQELPRSAVKVSWTLTDKGFYRVGYKGRVDLRCVISGISGFAYKSHLPVLGWEPGNKKNHTEEGKGERRKQARQKPPEEKVKSNGNFVEYKRDKIKKMKERNENKTSKTPSKKTVDKPQLEKTKNDQSITPSVKEEEQSIHQPAQSQLDSDSGRSVRVGDTVTIVDSVEILRKLQIGHGHCQIELMTKCAGRRGKVLEVDEDGDVEVEVEMLEDSKTVAKKVVLNSEALQLKGVPKRNTSRTGNCSETPKADNNCSSLPQAAGSKENKVPEELKRQFVSSAGQGNLLVVKRFLELYPDVVDCMANGQTALHQACHNGQTEVVDFLLKNGASLTKQDNQEFTALHHSCYGDISGNTAGMVIFSGANINDNRNTSLSTPLHLAVTEANLNAVVVVVQGGCDTNLQDMKGNTPLHVAILKGLPDIMEALLASPGLDLCSRDINGCTPVVGAICKRFIPIAIKMIDHSPRVIKEMDKYKMTVLHYAAVYDDLELVECILKHVENCDLQVRNCNGETALDLALKAGSSVAETLSRHLRSQITDQDGKIHISSRRTSSAKRENHVFVEGDIVRVRQPWTVVAALQHGHGGWMSLMKAVVGELGCVINIDNDGDVRVRFDHRGLRFIFNPVALTSPTNDGASSTQVRDDEPPVAHQMESKTVAHQVESKTVAHQVESKTVAHQVESKTVAHQVESKTVAHQVESKTVAQQVESKTVAQQVESKTVAHQVESKTAEKTTSLGYSPEDIEESLSSRDLGKALFLSVVMEVVWRVKEILGINPEMANHNEASLPVLQQACRGSSTEIIEALLDAGANMSTKAIDSTILHESATFDETGKTISLLLQKGHFGNPDVKHTVNERTPLHVAVIRGNVSAVKALVENGSDVKLQDLQGNTAFHFATANEREDIIEVLLDCEDLNLSSLFNVCGLNPIHIACCCGNVKIVKRLLQREPQLVNILSREEVARSPLHIACSLGHFEAVNELLQSENCDLKAEDGRGETALALALKEGWKLVVRRLVYEYEKTEQDDETGVAFDETFTPRFDKGDMVRVSASEEVLRGLQGKDTCSDDLLKTLGKEGQVLSADTNGKLEVLLESKQLIFHPCALTLVSKNEEESKETSAVNTKETARKEDNKDFEIDRLLGEYQENDFTKKLVEVVRMNDVPRMKCILQADPQRVMGESFDGNTALHLACQSRSLDVIRFLLERGADPVALNSSGFSPLHMAAACSAPISELSGSNAVSLLLEKGADANAAVANTSRMTCLHSSVLRGREGAVRVLIRNGADINARDDTGDTPLNYAIKLRNDNIVDDILACPGYDPLLTNREGFTAIHLAVEYDNIFATEKLCERDGGNSIVVDATNNAGATALFIAAANNKLEVLRILVEVGKSDVCKENNTNQTPLDAAMSNGHHEVVEVLYKYGASRKEIIPREDSDNPDESPGIMDKIIGKGRRVCGSVKGQILKLAGGNVANGHLESQTEEVELANESVKSFEGEANESIESQPEGGDEAETKDNVSDLSSGEGPSVSLADDLPGSLNLENQPKPPTMRQCSREACSICWDRRSNIRFEPCGHLITCSECGINVAKCPICREKIRERIVIHCDH